MIKYLHAKGTQEIDEYMRNTIGDYRLSYTIVKSWSAELKRDEPMSSRPKDEISILQVDA